MSVAGPRVVGVEVRPGPTNRGGGEYMGEATPADIPGLPNGGDNGLRDLSPGLEGVDSEDPP